MVQARASARRVLRYTLSQLRMVASARYDARMDSFQPPRQLQPKREAVDGVCVDCGREVLAAEVARVLRIDRAGRGRVVCNECSVRIHAAKQPVPIPLQRPTRPTKAGEPLP